MNLITNFSEKNNYNNFNIKDKKPISVPPEILQEIFKHLSVSDLINCKAVCSEWRLFLTDDTHPIGKFWQKIYQRDFNRQIPDITSPSAYFTAHLQANLENGDVQNRVLIEFPGTAERHSVNFGQENFDFSPIDQRLVVCSEWQPDVFYMWDLNSRICETINKDFGTIYKIKFSPCGNEILTVTSKLGVSVWNAKTYEHLHTFKIDNEENEPFDEHLDANYSPSGSTIAIVTKSPVVAIYNKNELEPCCYLSHDTNATCAVFVSEKRLISGDDRGRFYCWEISEKDAIDEIQPIIYEHTCFDKFYCAGIRNITLSADRNTAYICGTGDGSNSEDNNAVCDNIEQYLISDLFKGIDANNIENFLLGIEQTKISLSPDNRYKFVITEQGGSFLQSTMPDAVKIILNKPLYDQDRSIFLEQEIFYCSDEKEEMQDIPLPKPAERKYSNESSLLLKDVDDKNITADRNNYSALGGKFSPDGTKIVQILEHGRITHSDFVLEILDFSPTSKKETVWLSNVISSQNKDLAKDFLEIFNKKRNRKVHWSKQVRNKISIRPNEYKNRRLKLKGHDAFIFADSHFYSVPASLKGKVLIAKEKISGNQNKEMVVFDNFFEVAKHPKGKRNGMSINSSHRGYLIAKKK